jgi:23S rRNA (cytidine1920-2'-O)/16S rRNA (cytidine1409-2'-O)-methyltransferase
VRADIALVERGLARSRNHASTLIEAKRVLVQGKEVRKSSQNIEDDMQIVVLDAIEFVSRAGHKLARALEEFSSIEVQDRNCLDIGASTGGFTDVLLRLGAEVVVAVDVGHDQMVAELFDHPRVVALEGFNAREMSIEALRSATRLEINEKFFDLVVADVSFISLTLVLPAMREVAPAAEFVLLIKPQFEVGKDSLSANGIVNDHRLRAQAIKQVVDCAEQLGMGVRGLVRSGLPGTHGNVEYVLWISANEPKNGSKWTDQIEEIAREGK